MTKWPKFGSDFKVKVTYRKGKTRGVIAIPAPILKAWGYPDHIEICSGGDGTAILRPKVTKSDNDSYSD